LRRILWKKLNLSVEFGVGEDLPAACALASLSPPPSQGRTLRWLLAKATPLEDIPPHPSSASFSDINFAREQ
jgi:hypothetical protein